MARDERVIVMGEDIGRLGGVFRITDGLLDEFGPTRVIDTPLAESGIVGTAVGLAMRGFRPVVEIQFDGFVYPAFDQIVCQVAKLHYRTRGRVRMPMTIRIPWAGGVGAVEHHSESPEAYFVHTAGLRVVAVSNPQDAYTMLQQAIASDDPVVFFEPKRLYHTKGEVDSTAMWPMPLRWVSRASSEKVPTSRCSPTARRWRRRWMPRSPPRTTASPSRSSTCARSHPSTTAPSRHPSARRVASWSRMRRR
jgi:pyruvate/2-oxoglutarate/acetoin dehydrogenase E1 component